MIRNRAILVVDDDQDDVFFIKNALMHDGVAMMIQDVSDGHQAVDYLQGNGQYANRLRFPLPGFVLLDIKLPYMDGLEVLKWIRQDARLSLPVIMLSSSENELDIDAAYRLGANAYLIKPTDTATRLEIARAIKQFWFIHNQAPTVGK